MARKRIFTLILAAGTGNRFNTNDDRQTLPKQFAKIGDKTVLETAVNAFVANKKIDQIIVVTNEKYLELTNEIINSISTNKPIIVVLGGQSRFNSSYNGQKQIVNIINNETLGDITKSCENTYVLIHDAARAFVSQNVIDNVIKKLEFADGVQPVVPVIDTLIQKISGKWVTQNRDDYAFVQTPQGFKFDKIFSAYKAAINSPETSWIPTDDISVLQEYSYDSKIVTVSGDYHNRKITYPDDL